MESVEEPLANVLLHSDVVAALSLAATRRSGPLTTLDILLALIDVDLHGDWSWLQLESAFVDASDAARFAESETGVGGQWQGVPLSSAAAEALARAHRISEEYDLRPLPPGALALGLLWDSQSAATQAMLSEADVGQEELLELVQDSLLGVTLEGLRRPRARPDAATAPRASVPSSAEPSGWDDGWQLLESPATRRLDLQLKTAASAEAVLLAAFCLELASRLIAHTGWRAIFYLPLALMLTFAVGPPRRSPLTCVVRVLLAGALRDEALVVVAVLLMAIESWEFYVLMPRHYAAGKGGPLLSARETSRLRIAGLREVRAARAQRWIGMFTGMSATADAQPEGAEQL